MMWKVFTVRYELGLLNRRDYVAFLKGLLIIIIIGDFRLQQAKLSRYRPDQAHGDPVG